VAIEQDLSRRAERRRGLDARRERVKAGGMFVGGKKEKKKSVGGSRGWVGKKAAR